jgi:hypothetical protein
MKVTLSSDTNEKVYRQILHIKNKKIGVFCHPNEKKKRERKRWSHHKKDTSNLHHIYLFIYIDLGRNDIQIRKKIFLSYFSSSGIDNIKRIMTTKKKSLSFTRDEQTRQ